MNSKGKTTQIRNATILVLLLIGIILTGMSLAAEFLGLDLTPGFGMVQMFQLLLGITSIMLAGFLYTYGLRGPNAPHSLQANVGVRLAATGLVLAYVSGMSDLIGIGTHITPSFDRPFVGPLQLGGLLLGVFIALAGMFLYYTSRGSRDTSSMEFLINGTEK